MNFTHLHRMSADPPMHYSSSACPACSAPRYTDPLFSDFPHLISPMFTICLTEKGGDTSICPLSLLEVTSLRVGLRSTTSALWRWRSSPSVPVRSSSGGPSERRQRLSRQSLPDPAAPGRNCRRPGETEPRASGASIVKSLPPKTSCRHRHQQRNQRQWGVSSRLKV